MSCLQNFYELYNNTIEFFIFLLFDTTYDDYDSYNTSPEIHINNTSPELHINNNDTSELSKNTQPEIHIDINDTTELSKNTSPEIHIDINDTTPNFEFNVSPCSSNPEENIINNINKELDVLEDSLLTDFDIISISELIEPNQDQYSD
tara:strand:- start:373 stop:816 length:444 start_codon:yes stop_codon:yes gene_type:complete